MRYVASKLSAAPPIEGKNRCSSDAVGARQPTSSICSVDFYMESPYPTYLINSVYGAGKLLLRRWKGGMAEYHALIFTSRTKGKTKRLEDLRGKDHRF